MSVEVVSFCQDAAGGDNGRGPGGNGARIVLARPFLQSRISSSDDLTIVREGCSFDIVLGRRIFSATFGGVLDWY